MKGDINPLQSLKNVIACDPRDWANSGRRDAWTYGIVCGWGDAINEVATRYKWTEEDIIRLITQHMIFDDLNKALMSIADKDIEKLLKKEIL
jgi:hypothetical protein